MNVLQILNAADDPGRYAKLTVLLGPGDKLAGQILEKIQPIYKAAHGDDLRRQFRGVYTTTGFRLAGEYRSDASPGEQTHIASAIGIEKDTRLAALKLRLEQKESTEVPAIFFKLESRAGF